MSGAGPDRRSLLIGGASLAAGATMARSAAAQGASKWHAFARIATRRLG